VISVAFCIPGDITLPTGGYRYDREVLARFAAHGVTVQHVMLDGGWPHPSTDDVAKALAQIKALDTKTILLIDGLALGAMPPEAIAALPNRVVALVHHPLGLEAGTPPERAAFLIRNEQAVLAPLRSIIVTSDATKAILRDDFGVNPARITVAEPGTARTARATGTGQPLNVLAVGAVSPRKAFNILVEALAKITDIDWRLTIAGSLTLAPDETRKLHDVINQHHLEERIRLTGALDDAQLAACYATADIFAMSSLFEGYGMALAEALAHGLPIVTSSGGAAAQTVPDAAALKVPPGDTVALRDALHRAMTDAALRRRMADASWAAAALLPTWDDTTHEIADVIREAAKQPRVIHEFQR
jgi:glycosyltransferase involved in cell wall biosynthesis